MGYLFSFDFNEIRITNGASDPPIRISFSKPIIELAGDKIRIYDSFGRYDRSFYLVDFEDIEGDTPTSIEQAYDLLYALQASIGINPATVTVNSVVPGVGSANLGKAEDLPSASGHTVVAVGVVRQDSPSTGVSASGDYAFAYQDSIGRLWVNSSYASIIDQSHSHFRDTALSNTPVTVKASAGNLYGLNIINLNAVPVYVKFYNTTSAIVGASAVSDMYMVPASDGTTPGSIVITPDDSALYYFSTAIEMACVTGVSDSDATAPATAVYAKVIFK
jgi:hypothetical protein